MWNIFMKKIENSFDKYFLGVKRQADTDKK